MTCGEQGGDSPRHLRSSDRRHGAHVLVVAVVSLVALTSVLATVSGTVDAANQLGPPPGGPDDGTDCAGGLRAADLDAYFSNEQAGIFGADHQRAHRLADGRVLWTFHDVFLRTGDTVTFVHNAGLIQAGRCFRLLAGPGPSEWLFGDVTQRYSRWFWPLGGEMGADGNLHLFVAEMRERGPQYLSLTTPVAMHRVVIRFSDLAVIGQTLAAEPSAELFGWSVTSDEQWTYLYGHCFRQFGHGGIPGISTGHDPQCSAQVKVARVPKGRLWVTPTFWNGQAWQADRNAAVPVIPSWYGNKPRLINPTQVMRVGQQFVAVTKDADWWGDTIYLDTAPAAQGPWTTYHAMQVQPKTPEHNTYFASFVPWLDPDGQLIAGLSNNRWDGTLSFEHRPSFFPLPGPPPVTTPVPPDPVPAAPTTNFGSVTPCRLLDTRSAAGGAPGPGSVRVQVAGRCGVPAGATAAAFTLTVTQTSRPGFVTASPTGRPRPLVSNLNYLAGETLANGAVVRLGDGGAIDVYTEARSHLVVDVTGTFTPATQSTSGRFVPITGTRVIDTRVYARPGPGRTVRAPLPPEVPRDAVAVAVTLTTTASLGPGYFTVHPGGTSRPLASALNTDRVGQTRASGLIVPVSAAGLDVYTSRGDHVIVDVTGYLTGPTAPSASSGLFVPSDPVRLVDTRQSGPALAAGASGRVDTAVDASAVVANTTLVSAIAPGYLVLHPFGWSRPATSNVNAELPGETAAALTVTPLSGDGALVVYSSSGADILVDRAGWFVR